MNTPSLALPSALTSLRQQADAWWRTRGGRERQAVALVAFVLGVFVVWSVLVQPALRSVRAAPEQLDRLEAQMQQVQRVAAESTALRAAAPVSAAQAGIALKAASDRLGDGARLTLQGDRATLTFTGTSPDALRAWLLEARSGARARPVEAQLQRGAAGYSGTISVTLSGAAS